MSQEMSMAMAAAAAVPVTAPTVGPILTVLVQHPDLSNAWHECNWAMLELPPFPDDGMLVGRLREALPEVTGIRVIREYRTWSGFAAHTTTEEPEPGEEDEEDETGGKKGIIARATADYDPNFEG